MPTSLETCYGRARRHQIWGQLQRLLRVDLVGVDRGSGLVVATHWHRFIVRASGALSPEMGPWRRHRSHRHVLLDLARYGGNALGEQRIDGVPDCAANLGLA